MFGASAWNWNFRSLIFPVRICTEPICRSRDLILSILFVSNGPKSAVRLSDPTGFGVALIVSPTSGSILVRLSGLLCLVTLTPLHFYCPFLLLVASSFLPFLLSYSLLLL